MTASQRTHNSFETLLRRRRRIPLINALTDVYNAISVLHLVPIGGEELTRYEGSPLLVRAELASGAGAHS